MRLGLGNIVAIDTCNDECSVAIYTTKKQVAYLHEASKHMQASLLVKMLDDLLKSCSIGYGDIEAVALTIGPGSFTGSRIGVSCVYGLQLVIPDLLLIPVTTLCACSMLLPESCKSLCLLEAGRGMYYAQNFFGPAIPASESYMIDQLEPGSFIIKPNASLCGLAALKLIELHGPNACMEDVEPIYLGRASQWS